MAESTTTSPSTSPTTSPEEVLATAKQMLADGLVEGTSGNISARLADDLVCLSPPPVAYDTMTLDDLVVVDLGGDVPCCEYRPTGTAELGDEVAGQLAERGAALLANHGLVTCASTPAKALHHAALVERTAKIVWGTRAMGATVHPLPEEVNRSMAGVYSYVRGNP